MKAAFQNRLNLMMEKYKILEDKLSSGGLSPNEISRVSKEYSDLKDIVENIVNLRVLEKEIGELTQMKEDKDFEIATLAREELILKNNELTGIELNIKTSLLPKDVEDEKNAILEIRAGTGGEEAALFAGILLRMYQKYAEIQGWKWETLELNYTDLGGIKEASFLISGKNVFSKLKYESGVHRVQRVPSTETNGRLHTSAATVAVLPEIEDIDIDIEEKDIKVEITRSSGAGGQSVNTTDSAVKLTHLPTGITVSMQDERSQQKNKNKALKVLRARVYDLNKAKQDSERAQNRKIQIGTGDRSERIRTYNFPQGRVTDHRIPITIYNIDSFIEGQMDGILEELIRQDIAAKLAGELE